MLQGFRAFIMRGNVVDLAVAVVIGAAFGSVVTTFTNKIIQPLIAAVGGAGSIGLGVQLGTSGNAKTFIDIGALISAMINFLIVAAVVYFLIVLPMTKLAERRQAAAAPPPPPAPSEDVVLLTQIRDLLRERAG